MAELKDIANEFIRDEIEEFIERPDEIERIINLFVNASERMQNISAALIDGNHETVNELPKPLPTTSRPPRSWTTA
jgi:hypothetical protein